MDNSELAKLSIDELRTLNSKVVAMIKLKRKEVANEMKSELYVGDMVKVNHPTMYGKELKIVKINRTKAKLEDKNGMMSNTYNVPLSMIVPLTK